MSGNKILSFLVGALVVLTSGYSLSRFSKSQIAGKLGLIFILIALVILPIIFFLRAWIPIKQELDGGKKLTEIDQTIIAPALLNGLFGLLISWIAVMVGMSLFQ